MAAGGEHRLLLSYLHSFHAARRAIHATAPTDDSSECYDEYPLAVALRHYRLGLVDYARFVIARFWTAASPEAFAKKAQSPNTTLPNRDVGAALAFVERVHEALLEIEEEEEAATVIAAANTAVTAGQ